VKVTISLSNRYYKLFSLLFPGRSPGEVVKQGFLEWLKDKIALELSRILEYSNIEEIVSTMPPEVAVDYFIYVKEASKNSGG